MRQARARSQAADGVRHFLAAGVALALGLWMVACSDSSTGGQTDAATDPPPDVVMILVDTLRADHLGAYGYPRDTSPAIDALAAGGLRAERLFAQAPYTPTSVASLLTSTFPSVHGVAYPPSAKDRFRPVPSALATLPEAFRAGGYETVGVSSHPWIQPRFGFGRGFDRFEEIPTSAYQATRWAESRLVVDKALEILAAPRDRPLFLYVHLMGPHWPYLPGPEFGVFEDSEVDSELARELEQLPQAWMQGVDLVTARLREGRVDEADVEVFRARYDGLVRATDQSLGDLFSHLRDAGRLDDTMIALTADHGEEFLEHDGLFHRSLYNEVLHVPMILSYPRKISAGLTTNRLAQSVDLPVTLLTLAGVEAPESFVGRSLLTAAGALADEEAEATLVVSEYRRDRKVQSERWSLFLPGRGRPRLFDLDPDPGETENVARRHADVITDMEQSSDPLFEPMVAESESLRLDDDTRTQLQALGYLGDDDAAPASHDASDIAAGAASLVPGVRFSMNPMPLVVCDGSGLGVATMSWQVTKEHLPVEIRVRSADGTRMARSFKESGSAKTRKWVRDGATFHLVAADTGEELARLQAKVTTEGCGRS